MAPLQTAAALKRPLNISDLEVREIQSTKRLKLHDSSAKHSFDAPPTALYLFAGPRRRSAIGSILAKAGWRIHEVDILKQKKQDLSKLSLQKFYLDRISSNYYQALITSPPCDTFTRAKFANHNGHLRGPPAFHVEYWDSHVISTYAMGRLIISSISRSLPAKLC